MKVLVVGATGYLGNQIAEEVKKAGHELHALVREGSKTSRLEQLEAVLHRGDLTEKDSLSEALKGMDAVITSAIGYTGRRAKDSLESVDDMGNRNLALSAQELDIKKFVFISVLNADRAASVPHFHQKFEIENYLEELKVPFVSLRPGAFLDQNLSQSFSSIEQGFLPNIFEKGARLSFVLSRDVARFAVQSLHLKEQNPRVNLGFSEALSPYTPSFPGMDDFVSFVNSGFYMADTREQERLFGKPRSLSDAVNDFLQNRKDGVVP